MSPADELLAHNLLRRGLLDAAQVQRLCEEAAAQRCPLANAVARSGLVPPGALVELLASPSGPKLDTPTVLDPRKRAGWGGTVASRAPTGGRPAELDAPTLIDRAKGPQEPTLQGSASEPSSQPPGGKAPKRLGPFTIKGRIAEGGMGVVYRAYHSGLQRECAVKVLSPELRLDDETTLRFVAETRMAAQVGAHPNLVRVYDAGSSDGHVWLAMELIEGTTLSERIESGTLTPTEGAGMLVQVCDALVHVHEHGIIHRDLKPDNVFVDRDGVPKLGDFGIAKSLADGGSLTMTGSFLGTPAYMPPEQAEDARRADVRADVYGLGAVLYAVLTGSPPYTGSSAVNVMANLLEGPPKAPSSMSPAVDPALEAVCMRALERDPSDRYPDALSFKAALVAALSSVEFTTGREGSGRRPRASADRRQRSSTARSDRLESRSKPRRSSRQTRASSEFGSQGSRHGRLAPDAGGRVSSRQGRSGSGGAWRVLGAGICVFFALFALFALSRSASDEEPAAGEAVVAPGPPVELALRLTRLEPAAEALVTSPFTVSGEVEPADVFVTARVRSTKGDDDPAATTKDARAQGGRFTFELEAPDGEVALTLLGRKAGSSRVVLAERALRVDSTPPDLVLTKTPARVTEPVLVLKGTCKDASGAVTLSHEGSVVSITDGRFEHRVIFDAPGVQRLKLVARDAVGLQTVIEREVLFALPKLAIEVAARSITNRPEWRLTGKVTPAQATLRIAGEEVPLGADGSFSSTRALSEGENTIVLRASHAERVVSEPVVVTLDSSPPLVSLLSPKDFNSRPVRLALEFSEPVVHVQIGDAPAQPFESARERARVGVALEDGVHSLRIQATDVAGNVGQVTEKVVVDASPPQLEVEVQWRSGRTSILRGTLHDMRRVKLTADGKEVRVRKGAFSVVVPKAKKGRGSPPITLVATDLGGLVTRRVVAVGFYALPDRGRWSAATPEQQDDEIALAGRALGEAYAFQRTEVWKCGELRHRLATFRHVRSGVDMVLVPGGTFLQGLTPERALGESTWLRQSPALSGLADVILSVEMPSREVRVAPFLVGRAELRVGEWTKVGLALPEEADGAAEEEPVCGVTWNAAKKWLAAAGGGLRLPTESEWEYACRAGSETRFFWGDKVSRRYAVTFRKSPEARYPEEAGDRLADRQVNAFGLVDTLGNAYEWCEDLFATYDGNPLPRFGAVAPAGGGRRGKRRRKGLGGPRHSGSAAAANQILLGLSSTGKERVLRGGSCRTTAALARSSSRILWAPARPIADAGLRLVRSLLPTKKR